MSSRLLEILGRAMSFDVSDLIWHWFRAVESREGGNQAEQARKLDKVISLATRKRPDSAEHELRAYLAENPSGVYGQMAAAALMLEKNHVSEALAQLREVFRHQPSNTMALYAMGHCCERMGKEAEAVEYYQDCLKFKGYLQFPRQRLAAIYLKNGRLENAVREYESFRAEYPDDMGSLAVLGHLYNAVGRHSAAAEAFNASILMHPDNFRRDRDYVDELVEQDRLHEALEEVDAALADGETRVDMLVKRADILTLMGAMDESTRQYENAASACPDSLEAAIKLATQYLHTGQVEQAAHEFNRALDINDKIVEAYIGLCLAHKFAGNHDEALGILSLAASINVNSSSLFAETAILQFKAELDGRSGSYEGIRPEDLIDPVIRAHQDQTQRRPNNPELHYRLGVLLMAVERPGEAVAPFEAALFVNPTYIQARNKLSLCLYETDQKRSALENLVGPACLDRDTLELHYKTALLYCDRVKFASTLLNLVRGLEENFAGLDTTMNVAVVLQNLCLLDRTTTIWDSLAETAEHAIDEDGASGGN
jgi:tetratricopeptide (TPR) repeat protein